MIRFAAPVAGMRSLPVIKLKIFRWSFGDDREKKSQNHLTILSDVGFEPNPAYAATDLRE